MRVLLLLVLLFVAMELPAGLEPKVSDPSNRTIVLQIGMNMMGTGSLWRWFLTAGIPAIHWGGPRPAGSSYKRDPGAIRPLKNLGPASRYNDTTFTLAGVIYDNVASSRPIMTGLRGLFAALDSDRGAHFALCDMEELHADGAYMIEAYKYFREFDRELGGQGRFILTIRDELPWLESRFAFRSAANHGMPQLASPTGEGWVMPGTYWVRWAKSRDLPAEPCTVAAAMLAEKREHEKNVREYFSLQRAADADGAGGASGRLLVIDLTQQADSHVRLCEFLDIANEPDQCPPMPHLHDRRSAEVGGVVLGHEGPESRLGGVLSNCALPIGRADGAGGPEGAAR